MYICCWHLRSVMDLLPYGSSGTTPCLLYNLEEFSSYRVWFMVRSKTNFQVIRKVKGRPAVTRQSSIWRGFGGETFPKKFLWNICGYRHAWFYPSDSSTSWRISKRFSAWGWGVSLARPLLYSFLPPKLKIPDRTRNWTPLQFHFHPVTGKTSVSVSLDGTLTV